jgi:hypothetical protein
LKSTSHHPLHLHLAQHHHPFIYTLLKETGERKEGKMETK